MPFALVPQSPRSAGRVRTPKKVCLAYGIMAGKAFVRAADSFPLNVTQSHRHPGDELRASHLKWRIRLRGPEP